MKFKPLEEVQDPSPIIKALLGVVASLHSLFCFIGCCMFSTDFINARFL